MSMESAIVLVLGWSLLMKLGLDLVMRGVGRVSSYAPKSTSQWVVTVLVLISLFIFVTCFWGGAGGALLTLLGMLFPELFGQPEMFNELMLGGALMALISGIVFCLVYGARYYMFREDASK